MEPEPKREAGEATVDKIYKFPRGFRWGVSISTEQAAGFHPESAWYQWERAPGHIKDGSVSGVACDFLERWPQYLDLVKSQGHTAFRFSIDPTRWENGEKDKFVAMAEGCRKRGIEPVVTTLHFVLPMRFQEIGGWESWRTADWFAEEYIPDVAETFGDLVDFWNVVNEPSNMLGSGYWTGNWPPGKRYNLTALLRARRNLLEAITLAAARIKRINPNAKVSIAANIAFVEPFRPWYPLDRLLARIVLKQGDWWFIEKLAQRNILDYIGLNYYFRDRMKFNLFGWPMVEIKNENKVVSDFGWEIYPEGLYRVLLALWKRFRLPIFITENGVSDRDDKIRPGFIRDHILSMWRAIQEGVEVLGYLHWSLIDNFEWSYGFSQKFGINNMDFETLQVTPRDSANLFREVATQNAYSDAIFHQAINIPRIIASKPRP